MSCVNIETVLDNFVRIYKNVRNVDFSQHGLPDGIYVMEQNGIASSCTGLPLEMAGVVTSFKCVAGYPIQSYFPYYLRYNEIMVRGQNPGNGYQPDEWKDFK